LQVERVEIGDAGSLFLGSFADSDQVGEVHRIRYIRYEYFEILLGHESPHYLILGNIGNSDIT
jgi:hypothetical protein